MDKQQTILIADDESQIREILRIYFEKEGFKVIEAADGAEAIVQAQAGKPDILILDIMMPVLDGLEVCKQVRKISDMPIIMLTAKDEDDDRILGTLDWHQAGRFHDALKLGYEDVNNQLHLILAYNQDKQGFAGNHYSGGQPYKSMQTAWYQYKHNNNFRFSLLAMNLGLEAGVPVSGVAEGKTKYMQTLGGNVWYNVSDLSLFGSAYYQAGKTVTDNSISAYMLAAKGQYKFTPAFSAAIGIDYLSGQDDSDKMTRFDPLYGTHHKFYGTMDYFYVTPFGNGGLRDLYASLIFKPVPKLTVDLTYHNFTSQQDIITGAGDKKRGLGSEIDLTVTYPIRPFVVLQGGYSMMFGTDAFHMIKGGSKDKTQMWGFLSLNVNPEIFSSK